MDMDSSSEQFHHQAEEKAKPSEQAQKCPRCDSTNTKFCYYNNYSLSQPRFFCKSCRRYWTKGGALMRRVPGAAGLGDAEFIRQQVQQLVQELDAAGVGPSATQRSTH